MPVIIEIKARCPDSDRARAVLSSAGARKIGRDHQIDTYFEVPQGRMKLRQGTIENNLIFYSRPNAAGPKKSTVTLSPVPDSASEPLRVLLSKAIGVRCVVNKKRDIYFHGRVKLHVDEVAGLGHFVEIEVIDESDAIDESAMRTTCEEWMRRLGVLPEHLIAHSYSDMLEANSS